MTLTLTAGQRVHDRGANEFGDNITVGHVVRVTEPDDDGMTHVVVLTDSQPANPKLRRPALLLHHQDGRRKNAYEQLGPVAHLVRLPLDSIDPASLAHVGDHHEVWAAARKALFAAAVAALPGFRDRRAHDSFIDAYRVLRDVALEKERGIA